jgi:hypothetical protein
MAVHECLYCDAVGAILQIDIDHLIHSTEGMTGQDLMYEAFDRLGIGVSTINSKVVLEYMLKLRAEVIKVTDNVQAVIDEQSMLGTGAQSMITDSTSSAKKTIAGTITDITSKISGVFSGLISEQDLEAFSEVLLIFDGIRARRQVCMHAFTHFFNDCIHTSFHVVVEVSVFVSEANSLCLVSCCFWLCLT